MVGPSSIQAGAGFDYARSDGTLRDAARQLEGIFVAMMFEEMSKGLGGSDGLLPATAGREMYEQWFRAEVAEQFSRGGGLGLGDAIAGALEPPVRGVGPGIEAPALGRRSGSLSGLAASDLLSRPAAPLSVRREAAPPAASVPADRAGEERGYRRAEGASPERTAGGLGRPPPVDGPVTSPFGRRIHPITGGVHRHDGIDVAVPLGTPVHTPYGGRVLRVEETANLGIHVVVGHRGGYSSVYGHLSEATVKVGEEVLPYAIVGRSGTSGRSTGPHLHFGLYRHGQPIDPSRFVNFRR